MVFYFLHYNEGKGVVSMFKVEMGNPTNETIVFLHGGGLDHTQWKEVMHHLAERFHCMAEVSIYREQWIG